MLVQEKARQFLDILKSSDYTAVLTGAGVSTASGIPDFRSTDGLYSRISQKTFDLDFLLSRPEAYYQIAVEHIHPLADKQPNTTHTMLAELERRGLVDLLITQNIDGLHQKAGSENVVEFHGNVTGFHCTHCGKTYDRSWVEAQIQSRRLPCCAECGAVVRPDIVFFGDMIPLEALTAARLSAEQAELFCVFGSSLQVQPAAGIAMLAREFGSKLAIVNREPTGMDHLADWVCNADLTDFSKAVLDILLSEGSV